MELGSVFLRICGRQEDEHIVLGDWFQSYLFTEDQLNKNPMTYICDLLKVSYV